MMLTENDVGGHYKVATGHRGNCCLPANLEKHPHRTWHLLYGPELAMNMDVWNRFSVF
jgi:hypothetical protein